MVRNANPTPAQGDTSWYSWVSQLNSEHEALFAAGGVPYADAPNGTDDTSTIQAAAQNGLILRPGTYRYKSTGIDSPEPRLRGVSKADTIISIDPGVYLFDCNQQISDTYLGNFTTYGGAGILRNRYTGGNVTTRHRIENCNFYDFTAAAISFNSSDMPYVDVSGNVFRAANETTSVCVALKSGTDRSVIHRNAFYNYRIGVKLGTYAANTSITDNDFVHYTASDGTTQRTSIWLADPDTTPAQCSCPGVIIEKNKFGNENIGAQDHRILVANSLAGTYFGDQLPSTAAATGVVSGVNITNNSVYGLGAGPAAPGMVTTRTPEFSKNRIHRNFYGGQTPNLGILVFDACTPSTQWHTQTVIGPESGQYGTDQKAYATNVAALVYVVDDNGFLLSR